MLLRVWAYAGFAKGGPNFWGSGRVSYREGFGCILTVIFFEMVHFKAHFYIFLLKKDAFWSISLYLSKGELK